MWCVPKSWQGQSIAVSRGRRNSAKVRTTVVPASKEKVLSSWGTYTSQFWSLNDWNDWQRTRPKEEHIKWHWLWLAVNKRRRLRCWSGRRWQQLQNRTVYPARWIEGWSASQRIAGGHSWSHSSQQAQEWRWWCAVIDNHERLTYWWLTTLN